MSKKLNEEQKLLLCARKHGYCNMFYTPKNLQEHIDKYINGLPDELKTIGYTLAIGVTNYYAMEIAKDEIEKESKK